MAQRTDTFVAQEWTVIDANNENTNFFGQNPITLMGTFGFQKYIASVLKFGIPAEIKKRKLIEIKLELYYYDAVYHGHGETVSDMSWMSINVDAPGQYEDGRTPDAIDLNSITWRDYKKNYYILTGSSSGTMGKPFLTPILFKYTGGQAGTLTDIIWSNGKVSTDSVYYNSPYSLFKYDSLLINVDAGSLKINPNQVKLIITTDDVEGNFPVNLKKPLNNTFLRKDKDNEFSWDVGNIDYVFYPVTPNQSIISWKQQDGETWTDIQISSSDTNYLFPKETFTSDNFLWKVQVTSDQSISSVSQERSFTTVDYISNAKPISPVSIIVDNNKDLKFSWEHNISSGTAQTKAELEYSDSQLIDWKPLISIEGESKEAIIPAGTLPTGNLIWRVRTYNADQVAGNWSSEAEIVSRGSSPAPIITSIKAVPKLELEWQSDGQISAEIKIGNNIYKAYGNSKKFTSPIYLEDGSIKVSVRILNEFDLWSEWSSETVEIKNNFLGSVELTANVKNYGIELKWNLAGTSSYIYRNGLLVGKTTDLTYIDYEALGKNEYYVMIGSADGNYAKSSLIVIELLVPMALIKDKGTDHWIILEKKRGGYPSHKTNSNMKTTYQFYAGRELPVAYSPENLNCTHTFEFSTKSRELAKMIASLAGKEVIYKDCRGDIVIGVMNKITQTTDIATDISFQITETSKELITFD